MRRAGSSKSGSTAATVEPKKSTANDDVAKTRKPSQRVDSTRELPTKGSTVATIRAEPAEAPIQDAPPRYSRTRLWVAAAVFTAVTVICVAVYLLVLRKPRIPLEKCTSAPCLDHAKRLLASLNASVDPCRDFYAFACGRWQSTYPGKSVQDALNEKATQDEIKEVSTDLWQVGRTSLLYHKCLNPQPSDIAADVAALKETMRKMLLTWPMDEPQPTDAHPLDVMIEMAYRWDVNFVFTLMALHTKAIGRILVLRRAYSRAAWVDRFERSLSSEEYEKTVREHLTYLGANFTNPNCTLLQELERSFIAAKSRKSRSGQKWFEMTKIDYEAPSLNSETWLQYLHLRSEEFGFEWSPHDTVLLEDADILADVEKLFKKHTHTELLIGIAWMFLQSHMWAIVGKPELMFRDNVEEKKKYACVEYVNLRLGLLSSAEHLGRLYPTNEDRREASNFLYSLKSAVEGLVRKSQWIDGQSKHTAEQKLTTMRLNILPDEQFFVPARRTHFYEGFPSMKSPGFFSSWLRASLVYQRLHNHERFRDVYEKRRTLVYEPYAYSYLENDVHAATVALEPPMHYQGAPLMINYGGAGVSIARQIVKSFDPRGVNVDHHGETASWWGNQHSSEYNGRASCHLGQGTPATMSVFPTIPAIEVAFSAYKRELFKLQVLAGTLTDLRIPGLESYSSDMVFFMSYCYALCSKRGDKRAVHECNVPLRHSYEFATAFQCAPRSPMNAEEKCTFFS
ncbi:hypothetical protein HPB50_017892 [Hyalomma asiaticum]|uniref:Uncharacterized protein n=1 Tax=Hyalomma asiaticum TaxID=266040 RepID=A0ACB7T5J1_HYAAI|nr:hypothetical protein HPB50_017892 [Hyalomma asiaticum]